MDIPAKYQALKQSGKWNAIHALAEEIWTAEGKRTPFIAWYKLIEVRGVDFMRERWEYAKSSGNNIRSPVAFMWWVIRDVKPTLKEVEQ